MDVIEFEITARLTTLPARAGKGALPLVSLPNRTANVCGDVSSASARACTPRASCRSELLTLELEDQGLESTVEHLGDVPASDRMTKQSLRIAQFLVRPVVDGHPQAVPLQEGRGVGQIRRSNSPRGEFIHARVA
jgi:hypothetical protein